MYESVDSGVKIYRSRKPLGYSLDTDIDFGIAYPVYFEFILPGDVIKLSSRIFARYQPTLAPVLNGCKVRMRYFFVNLRQIESKTETIITGSKDGQQTADVPAFKSFIDDVTDDDNYIVKKYGFWDYLGVPCKNYKNLKGNQCLPANYWFKALKKIEWDYYRDENFSSGYDDFDSWFDMEFSDIGGQAECFSVNLRKDYFTSSTPFELKGDIPTFDVEVTEPFESGAYSEKFHLRFPTVLDSNYVSSSGKLSTLMTPVNYSEDKTTFTHNPSDYKVYADGSSAVYKSDLTGSNRSAHIGVSSDQLNGLWNGFSGSFNARDVQRMFALTRIKERDMRCGSRYTEYLRANFKISPADETLQRPVYLGGFVQPIVTNEVLQTSEGTDPVGTMRGKGITDGGNTIKPYHAKEFGVIFGLLDVLPDLIYTQGIDRRLTYKSRFNFFNPSFQNLSEQEVLNGEIYIDENDGLNDETFGFQGMYNEMRSRRNIVTGDLRDGLKYWTQAIEFQSRPNLNASFIKAQNYQQYFKRPFAVDTSSANPIILHVDNIVDAYRPMVSEPVPGLTAFN